MVKRPFGERLARLRTNKGLSQYKLAELLGFSRGQIANYEHGTREPDHETLRRLADFFGVTTDYLLGRTDDPAPLPKNAIPVSQLVKVPIVGTIRAGEPILAAENIEGYEMVSAEQVKNGTYFFLRVKGDSMIGAGIREGYLVLVRKQEDVEDGDIAVVLVDDEEATLKRVYRADGKWILHPENPAMKPIVVEKRDVKIVGRVMLVQFEV